jgi:arylsulfatase A-like enzyme
VNEAWRGKSGLKSDYADLVMETDAVIGRVLNAIQSAGVANNTLVLFTSDNGCASYIGVPPLEAQGHFPSGPLRDYKASVYEGGHRVPFVVRWPSLVEAGSVCKQLVHQADLIATMAEILGTQLPDQVGEDSFSFLPLLRGEDHPIREHSVNTACGGTPSLREGPWKLVLAADSILKTPVQLFNLDDDLGETTNVASMHPDRVKSMQAMLEEIIRNGRSTPGIPQKNDVRVTRYPKAVAPAKSKQ